MFAHVLDEEDRRRVSAERRAHEALQTLCERAPLRVVVWVAALLERICGRVLERQGHKARAA